VGTSLNHVGGFAGSAAELTDYERVGFAIVSVPTPSTR
jgi:hypothetical protein